MSNGNLQDTRDSVQEKIRERIQSNFVDLIPQEQWDELVQSEINRFIENKECYHTPFGSREKKPKIKLMIEQELDKQLRQKVYDELQKPEWQSRMTDAGTQIASEAVENMLKNHMEEVFTNFVSGMAQSIAFNMAQKLREDIQNKDGMW